MQSISALAESLGISPDLIMPFGRDMAKVTTHHWPKRKGKLILVSATTPTPAGEGKTTTSIGLADAMRRMGQSVCLSLREPSMGPVFGAKGGGTGGGKSQLHPSERINLHFVGDIHAITSAHNLIASMVDQHLHFDRNPSLDSRTVGWKRVIDLNDRALREVVVGLGGKANGFPRQSGFDITAASEVMAILALAKDEKDLRRRISSIVVGTTRDGTPVTANDLGVTGAAMTVLRDAMFPNLVQTLEGTPAFVHAGPFANIAHGASSIQATQAALSSSDWAITEAGFAFDLGGEKFFDIVCPAGNFEPALVVLVTTLRALKFHGGVPLDQVAQPNQDKLEAGFANLHKHLDNVAKFGKPALVAINRRETDTEAELSWITNRLRALNIETAVCDHYAQGGEGAMQLAEKVMTLAQDDSGRYSPMYDLTHSAQDKLLSVARNIYGAKSVTWSSAALASLSRFTKMGFGQLPICVAKTHLSLSHDPKQLGRPTDFDFPVRSLELNAGAGFLVALAGEIVRMPGLPSEPQLLHIDCQNGEISGLK